MSLHLRYGNFILKATVHDIHVYVLTKFLPTKVVDFQPKYQSVNTQ